VIEKAGIKQMQVTSQLVQHDSVFTNQNLWLVEFGDNGYLVREAFIGDNGLSSEDIYTYKNGKLVQHTSTWTMDGMEDSSSEDYIWQDGKLLQITEFNLVGLSSKLDIIYKNTGQPEYALMFIGKAENNDSTEEMAIKWKTNGKTVFNYQGNLMISSNIYKVPVHGVGEMELVRSNAYEYDTSGKLIKHTSTKANGLIDSINTYTYSSSGLMLSQTQSFPDKNTQIIYTYTACNDCKQSRKR
jgi:hypothetical protein